MQMIDSDDVTKCLTSIFPQEADFNAYDRFESGTLFLAFPELNISRSHFVAAIFCPRSFAVKFETEFFLPIFVAATCVSKRPHVHVFDS
jgi:hypothetical protein